MWVVTVRAVKVGVGLEVDFICDEDFRGSACCLFGRVPLLRGPLMRVG